jgi:hypothetical protein
MDGMTILALVIRRLRPHHKVDMYAEIGLVKKLTLAQSTYFVTRSTARNW